MDELVKIEGTFDAEAPRVLRETPGLTASPVANEDLKGFGNFVILESEVEGETYYQVFAHMKSFEPGIDQGSVVDEGTLLGLMGSTGSSTGPHVHWEIRREDAVTVDGGGVHGFSTWYPQDEEEMNELFVNPDDFAGMLEPPPPRDPRMTANGKVAGLALVALIVFVACSVTSSGTAPGGTATWSGLTYDPDQWQVGADASGESLANLLDPACSLRFIQGGSDLPPGWSVRTSTDTFGPNAFEIWEVASPEGAEYVNYFYESGDSTVNLGGFQLTLSSSEAETCSTSAEELLATLDPQGLVVPTGTAAG